MDEPGSTGTVKTGPTQILILAFLSGRRRKFVGCSGRGGGLLVFVAFDAGEQVVEVGWGEACSRVDGHRFRRRVRHRRMVAGGPLAAQD